MFKGINRRRGAKPAKPNQSERYYVRTNTFADGSKTYDVMARTVECGDVIVAEPRTKVAADYLAAEMNYLLRTFRERE